VLFVPFATLCSGLLIDARDKSSGHDRVVVVGDWADAATLYYELDHGAERAARIVDLLTPGEAAATVSGHQPLRELVQDAEADIVVLDRAAQLDATIVEQVAALHESGVRVRTLSLFYEEWLGKLPISELERVSLMFDIGEVHRVRYGRFKRVVDVALSAVGCAALLCITPLVVVGNLVANRGPLLYKQARVGKNGRIITILKFRTMRGAHGGGSEWTSIDDPRITPFGSLLRRTHLDELPQMLNILRGDLSLVGPRPEQPQYVAELTEKLPFYNLRHLVRPGLTGWAQVKYGYAANDADALEKLQYEFYYLRHQKLTLDLRIVVRTLRAVVRGAGR
jgi:lipopolysaccharide/colanic/teichoic acid biosynthesis glycosyltransferase